MKKINFSYGYAKYEVEVEPKKYIIVKRDDNAPTKFEIGDIAEYDSYNLHYTGIIRSITEKTVTIEAYPGTQNARKYRLKLDSFSWRNWNFNVDAIRMKNSETMMYI